MPKKSLCRLDVAETDASHTGRRIHISKMLEIADIGTHFSRAVNSDQLLSMILKQTLELMGVEICVIWLKDKKGNLIPKLSFGFRRKRVGSIKLNSGSVLVKRILSDETPSDIADLAVLQGGKLKKIIKEENVGSILSAPLKVEDQVIGALMIFSKGTKKFEEVDIKIFNAICKQSALAIADIGLYDKVEKRAQEKAKEMSMLFTMSRSISSSVSIDLLLSLILEKACVLMKAKFCTLKVLDAAKRHLHLIYPSKIGKDSFKIFSEFDNEIASKVIRTGIPLVVNDIKSYFRNQKPSLFNGHRVKSMLTVPLFSKGRKIGVLSIYVAESRFFQKEDIDMLDMIASLCSVAIENTRMLDRIRRDYFNIIKTLAKIIDENDTYTRGHCDKVMRYSLLICKKMKLRPADTNTVKIASLLHDIGKVGIDLNILRKSGKLSKSDWDKMRLHPEIGANIVRQIGFLNDIVPIIKYHHARYDGTGYPADSKSGDKIPLGSRIIAVADAFDAMTSDRPYRKAMPEIKAVRELKRCSGSQFDPGIVDLFLGNISLKSKTR